MTKRRDSSGRAFAREAGLLTLQLHQHPVPYREALTRWRTLVRKHSVGLEPDLARELRRRGADHAFHCAVTFDDLLDADVTATVCATLVRRSSR